MHKILRTLTVATLVLLPLAMSACNTIEGAGKDTKAAGQAVQDSADKNK